jgi:hypothetical protein
MAALTVKQAFKPANQTAAKSALRSSDRIKMLRGA